MAPMAIPDEALDELRARLRGPVTRPGDAVYDETRRVHNGLIDRRPALVASCRGTADVVDALGFAREHRLPLTVRGGGHNVAGSAVIDGGMMVDLSLMKGIHVDPGGRRARVEGGATWKEFDREAHLFGLATTGGVVSSTGVAGLTLGGGIGHLMGQYGLSVDNLLSAEVVLADGRVVTATEENEPGLFWALRGGGGSFGIVTSLEFRMHPVSMVTAGLVAHPLDRAADFLRFVRDRTREVPEEVALMGGFVHAPDGSGAKLGAVIVCDSRPVGTDDGVVEAIRSFGSPVVETLRPMPYPVVNQLLDPGFPKGALNYWKAGYLDELPDEAIDGMAECFAASPSPMDSIGIEHFHGAVHRVAVEATAYPHRRANYQVGIYAQCSGPELVDACTAWARETRSALEPYLQEGGYMNYLGEDAPPEEAANAFGPNLARLQEIKARYDPGDVLGANGLLPARGAGTAGPG